MTASASPALAADGVEPGRSLWQDAWARLRRNRMAVIGGAVLLVLAALSLFGPLFLAYSYEEQNLGLGAAPPSAAHLLGTDKLGRDQLARLFFGGRVSLLVGLAATSVSLTIGVLWGSIAGYAGGKLDAVMMRVVDILYADRKSTRLNSSHSQISYAVFCLRSEEHTSELQSQSNLVCRLLLEKKRAHV